MLVKLCSVRPARLLFLPVGAFCLQVFQCAMYSWLMCADHLLFVFLVLELCSTHRVAAYELETDC